MIAKVADPIDVSVRIGLHMQGMNDRSQKGREENRRNTEEKWWKMRWSC